MKIKNICDIYLTHRELEGKCAYSSSNHYSNNLVIAFKQQKVPLWKSLQVSAVNSMSAKHE